MWYLCTFDFDTSVNTQESLRIWFWYLGFFIDTFLFILRIRDFRSIGGKERIFNVFCSYWLLASHEGGTHALLVIAEERDKMCKDKCRMLLLACYFMWFLAACAGLLTSATKDATCLFLGILFSYEVLSNVFMASFLLCKRNEYVELMI